MAGLLTMQDQPMPPPPASGGGAMPPEAGETGEGTATDSDASQEADEDGAQPNVTPEEQAQYDQFVKNGMQVIWKEDGSGARDDILNRLSESKDPLENLANTAAWLVTMLETSAEKGGTQLEDSVVMHGGQALFEELAQVAQMAKIHDYSEKEMQGAWYRALDVYRESATQSGKINPDDLKQQFGEIQQADQSGQMDQLLPGIDKAPGEQDQEGQ